MSEKRELTCHGCGGPLLWGYLWKALPEDRNPLHQTIPIICVTRCCGVQAHTEVVALAVDYMHDGKGNAERICQLMNADNERRWAELATTTGGAA